MREIFLRYLGKKSNSLKLEEEKQQKKRWEGEKKEEERREKFRQDRAREQAPYGMLFLGQEGKAVTKKRCERGHSQSPALKLLLLQGSLSMPAGTWMHLCGWARGQGYYLEVSLQVHIFA